MELVKTIWDSNFYYTHSTLGKVGGELNSKSWVSIPHQLAELLFLTLEFFSE